MRVGLATFDSAVQFFSLRSGLAAPAMLVVSDAERPFCPEPASLVVPLQASRALVRPPRGFRSSTSPARCWTPSCAVAQACLGPVGSAGLECADALSLLCQHVDSV